MARIEWGYIGFWVRVEPRYQYRRYSEKFWIWFSRKVIHTTMAKWIVITACCRAMGGDQSPDQVNAVDIMKAIEVKK